MKQFLLKKILLLSLITNANAIDLPSFWRATQFQGEPGSDLRDFVTYVNVKGSYGTTRGGYDANSNSVNILNIHGLADVNVWGINMENLTAGPSKPKTYQYLRETDGIIPALGFTGDNGKLEINGKLKTHEIAIEVRQNIKCGFYGKIHAPFRRVRINEITVTNKTNPSLADAATFQSFLDDELDNVLAENGLEPITVPFNRNDLHDMALLAGWEGYSDSAISNVKSVRGGVAAMLTIPVGSHEKLHRVVSLPLGYDGHWGLGARACAQVHLSDWFALGANAGVDIFLSRTTIRRMKTTTSQCGLVILERGNTEIDPGSIFDLSGYIKIDKPISGLYAIAAYSFSTREKSRFYVKDASFLNTFVTAEQASGIITNSKNGIVNTDERLKQWFQHTVQLLAGYDFKAKSDSNFAPHLEIFYNVPIFGKKCWKTDMIGGNGGLIIKWNF